MEFNLTREEKIRSIDSILLAKQTDLYNNLLSAGFNPETFDESSYSIPEEALPLSVYHRIAQILEEISSINAVKNSL